MSEHPDPSSRRPTPAGMPRRRASVAVHRPTPQPPGGRATRRDGRGGASGAPPTAPDPLRDHRAVAPYGLVPLPDRVMPAERLQEPVLRDGITQRDLLAGHDRRIPGTHSGWIDVEVRTLTPTFVGATRRGGGADRSLTIDGHPALPGATLRGLTRNVLRALTGGETGPVNTPQLFFRAPAAAHANRRARHVMRRMSRQYRARNGPSSSPPGAPVKAGFLCYAAESGAWSVHPLPVKRPLQVRLEDLRRDLSGQAGLPPFEPPPDNADGETYVPAEFHGAFQYLDVVALCPDVTGRTVGEYRYWAMAVVPDGVEVTDDHEEAARRRLRQRWAEKRDRVGRGGPGGARGRRGDLDRALRELGGVRFRRLPCVLVLTGTVGERRNAYLFPTHTDPARRIPVPDDLVRLVESADQITRFQEDNFPADPAANGRPRDGGLDRDARQPVWYQEADGRVVSFGRSGGYRVAVGEFDPIRRAVPEEVLSPQRDSEGSAGRPPDVPRALFGDVDLLPGDGGGNPAARGRVSTGSAVSADPDPWFPHTLRVELLSPQRSCFANYLLQPMDERTWGASPDLVTWAHEGDVRLGGYKVYLHRHDTGTPDQERYAALRADRVPDSDTKRDIVPLRAGLTFHGRLTFSNLTDAEVGGVLRALLLGNPVDGGDPDDPLYAHKVGMGKALGFGSVHITPRLHLVDPAERAACLDPGAGVHRVGEEEARKLLDSFDDALLGWERERNMREGRPIPDDWRDIARVEALLLAAQWRDRLPESWTRVMELAEFAAYPVLPGLRDRFAAHARSASRGPG